MNSLKNGITSAGLLVLVLGSAGWGGCEYFNGVTIPTSDTKPPIPVSSLIPVGGERQNSFAPIVIETSDEKARYLPIASAVDTGGLASIGMGRHVKVYCRAGSIGSVRHFDFFALTKSQSGSPGDEVSNGLYVVDSFNVDDYTSFCGPDDELEVTYSWSISATDFHGNRVDKAGGSIKYTR